jgi:transposase InsO family protein
VSEITYIGTLDGWLYLAVIMDLFSRKVIGWKLGDTLESELVVTALKGAPKGEINPRYEPSVTRISCTLAPLWLATAFKIALSVPTNSRS